MAEGNANGNGNNMLFKMVISGLGAVSLAVLGTLFTQTQSLIQDDSRHTAEIAILEQRAIEDRADRDKRIDDILTRIDHLLERVERLEVVENNGSWVKPSPSPR